MSFGIYSWTTRQILLVSIKLKIVVIIMSLKADNYLMITFDEYLKNSICFLRDRELFSICALTVLVKRHVIFCISKFHLKFVNSFKTLHVKFYTSSSFFPRRRNVYAVSDRYWFWLFRIANFLTIILQRPSIKQWLGIEGVYVCQK